MPTPAEPSGPRPPTGPARPRSVAGVPLEVLAKLAHARHPAGPVPDAETQHTVVVRGVTLDSRAVRLGDLYAALPGSRAHGATFAGQAAELGAVGVLTDADGVQLLAAQGCPLPVLEVDDARAVLGEVAAAVYGHPADQLVLFGVTGTNGKTTTTYLLDGALRAAGLVTGMLGTVETRVGAERRPSVRTTPEAPDVQALLARMVEAGATTCAMEVSSHALCLHRVDGVVFDVAGFTNLSQDHLDFHAGMEDYFQAKATLFTPARARAGVVCVDDAWGQRLAREASIPVTTFTTGTTATGPDADWRVEDLLPEATGSSFGLVHRDGRRVALRSPLPGAFNVANTALAYLMLAQAADRLRAGAGGTRRPGLESSGQQGVFEAAGLAAAVARAGQVPGRMELVDAGEPAASGAPRVLVDYAHTPDAVRAALEALAHAPRPLVVVLGAGGDRDPLKRGPMGGAAARLADVVVVTDDNPRSEPPEVIRAAVLAGAVEEAAGREPAPVVLEVPGRRAAVAEAVRRAWGRPEPAGTTPGGAALDKQAAAGGTVLLAGKGHEQGQEVAGVVHPFDDRAVAREILRQTGRSTEEESST